MKKIWSYISAIFGGIILGIIIGAKFIGGDDYKAYIKKIKQKGREQAVQDVSFVPIFGRSDDKTGKSITRKQKRRNKRLLRLQNKV